MIKGFHKILEASGTTAVDPSPYPQMDEQPFLLVEGVGIHLHWPLQGEELIPP
jgi:hypothetical protein